MVKNVKYYEGAERLKKEQKKTVLTRERILAGALVVIVLAVGGYLLGRSGNEKVLSNQNQTPTKIEVTDVTFKEEQREAYYSYDDICIDVGTKLTLEPSETSSYVTTVDVSNHAKLIAIDYDYALVKYKNIDNKFERLGYVPIDKIHPLASKMIPTAAPCLEYVGFDGKTRIRDNSEDGEIVATAYSGDYGRVVAFNQMPEWENNESWYIVTYNGHIGYMQGKNGEFINPDQMIEKLSTPCEVLEITGKNVNFRSYPSKDDRVERQKLNKGDVVILLDDTSNPEWYIVSYNGKTGYLSKELTCFLRYQTNILPKGLESLNFDRDIAIVDSIKGHQKS